MIKKSLLIGLMITMFLVSGCAVSDYLTGASVDQPYSLLPEEDTAKDDSSDEELDEILNEIDELEKADSEEEVVEEETTDSEEVVEEEEAEEVVEEEEEEAYDAPIKITVKENDVINLKPKAKDADDDMITYTFSEPLDSNGRWESGYGDAGEYLISVTASDGTLETTKTVLLVVERVNVAPGILGVSDKITVEEGDVLELSPEADDPNGDDVEITISEPVGEDGEWIIGYTDAGDYTVTITATDGELETVKEVEVVVEKKNVAPTISNVEEQIEIDEGDIISISPEVEDLNGDDIEVTIDEPVGDSGIWETDYNDHGTYTVVVKATDGQATTTKEVLIVVNDINVAPVIEDIVQNTDE